MDSVTLRSLPAASDENTTDGIAGGGYPPSKAATGSNKGKRASSEETRAHAQSSKKRAAPLQDLTNSFVSQKATRSSGPPTGKRAGSGRVTRSMTKSRGMAQGDKHGFAECASVATRHDPPSAAALSDPVLRSGGAGITAADPTSAPQHATAAFGEPAGQGEAAHALGAQGDAPGGCTASTTRNISRSFAQQATIHSGGVAGQTVKAVNAALPRDPAPAFVATKGEREGGRSRHGERAASAGSSRRRARAPKDANGGPTAMVTSPSPALDLSIGPPAPALRGASHHAIPAMPQQVNPRSSARAWKDVDVAVRHDMRMCAEYVNEVYENAQVKQQKHRPNPQYMELHQRDITVSMRGILIDWLVEVAQEYNQSAETLFLSISYIDGYLSKARCVRSKLQLIGITCMHIASKYQEIYPPAITEFCYITDNTYDRDELIEMERKLLDVLDFKLSVPTTWMFLVRYLRVAEADRKTELVGMYLSELSLLEYALLQFLPAQVAAAAVMLALHHANQPHWTATLEHYTGYTPRGLRECAQILHRAHCNAKASTLPAIREKYAAPNLLNVSSLAVKDLKPELFDQPY